MNTLCTPQTCAQPTAGVTENLRKPLYTLTGNADAYEVRVELPGVPKANVKIDLEDNVLSIRAERASPTNESWKPLHREISAQNYLLRLRLNAPVDEEKLNARLEDGILTLNLPIREVAKPRRIEVN